MYEIHIYTRVGWWETQVCAGTSYGNVVLCLFWWYYSTFQVLLVSRWSAGATGWIATPPPPHPSGSVSLESLDLRKVGCFWGTGSFRLRWRRVRGGRGRPHAGSSPSRMVLRCPGGGKVNLLFVPSLHFGEEEGERAAQREGGRRLAGRAGLRKQESRGGATGERGKSCQWQGAVREEGRATGSAPNETGSDLNWETYMKKKVREEWAGEDGYMMKNKVIQLPLQKKKGW